MPVEQIQDAKPYEITAPLDGQRFLVNLETGSSDSPITVVVNWTAGLKK